MDSRIRFNQGYDATDVPIPTTRLPTAGPTIRRAKTLTRPERGVAQAPLINPPAPLLPSSSHIIASTAPTNSSWGVWPIFARILTFWAPGFLLKSVGGLKDKAVQQAWREKIALCFIALLLGAVIGFATVGMQKVLCPGDTIDDTTRIARKGTVTGVLGIQGFQFNISQSNPTEDVNFFSLAQQNPGEDITPHFQRTAASFPACKGLKFRVAVDEPCNSSSDICSLPPLNTTSTFTTLGLKNTTLTVGYDWDQVATLRNYFVIDGAVLNMDPYMQVHTTAIQGDAVDAVLRVLLRTQSPTSGKDGTRLFYNRVETRNAVPCLMQRYYAGNIDKVTPGCFASQLFLYAGLIIILGIVLVRFAMACVFNWFMSARLAGPPDRMNLSRTAISPAVLPEGANISISNRSGTAPWAANNGSRKPNKLQSNKSIRTPPSSSSSPTITLAQIGAELFAVCLVTCYSEGEDSLRTTMDSISQTSYSDTRKLLFVVADGMITGAGEKRSTPDIAVSLLEADPRFGNPMPMSYIAVGSGAKGENRAMVYAGHYTVAGRRTPTVIVVKCGTEAEARTDKKPGNRGKRDSQLILMNFFSHVTFNDRMTPLDFDLFRKIHVLMGVTPDFFEVCLMVDADTKVYPDSLKYLVNCMHHDPLIMGVCGETRIANKRQSWVTAIQVYEYFISHHLAKAFESVFGGVTCLPGCFSMFRLKARKQSADDWIPLITKPEIVKEYSQCEVVTLHQKNLLLLGEDRFLTTILLRTFPNRKMVFLPQAKCRTVAPDSFKVLLSQRRRWINSTIHNLMELVLVRNLCGTFCFSMQFVVFMDLLGTTVLPVALSLTYALVAGMALDPPHTFEQAIPLMLLLAVIGLPAILILITTRKVVYVFWMLIYLAALPVWNFILPLYSFWHFDDFSWGETRKVEGEGKDGGHGDGAGTFDRTSVPLRRWEDWERSRLRKLKREERRRKEMERAFPSGYHSDGDTLSVPDSRSTFYDGSDTGSIASSDEDHWGMQIGGYNEHGSQFPPPPNVLLPRNEVLNSAETVGGADLEAMLEMGFEDERDSPPQSHRSNNRSSQGSSIHNNNMTRFQLSDSSPKARFDAYPPMPNRQLSSSGNYVPQPHVKSPISPTIPTNGISSALASDWQTHAKKRSGGKAIGGYGPLGPLDPDSRF